MSSCSPDISAALASKLPRNKKNTMQGIRLQKRLNDPSFSNVDSFLFGCHRIAAAFHHDDYHNDIVVGRLNIQIKICSTIKLFIFTFNLQKKSAVQRRYGDDDIRISITLQLGAFCRDMMPEDKMIFLNSYLGVALMSHTFILSMLCEEEKYIITKGCYVPIGKASLEPAVRVCSPNYSCYPEELARLPYNKTTFMNVRPCMRTYAYNAYEAKLNLELMNT
uniref:Uncharacterized protein n=1 Tax=Glossina pallidipes TaxID=7398 RepID=A0A1A9ZAY3_GLOPL